MGTVIINGKRYDAQSGLALDIDDSTKETRVGSNFSESKAVIAAPIKNIAVHEKQKNASVSQPKQKRVSKQQRLAEAVAEEFAEDIPKRRRAESKTAITTKPLTVAKAKNAAPNWIKNFNAGNPPIEIQPVVIAPKRSRVSTQRSAAANNSRSPKNSATLSRRFVRKPANQVHGIQQINVARRQPKAIPTHPSVHRFAPIKIDQPAPIKIEKPAATIAATLKSIAPADSPFHPAITHQAEKAVVAHRSARAYKAPEPAIKKANSLSGSALKNALIQEQLDRPIDRKSRDSRPLKTRRHFRASSLVTAAFAIMLLGGYMAYVNMPSISVRIAAANAGIAGRSPYAPDGYSIDGSVAYAPGSITINYKSNGDGKGYSVIEQKTDVATNETLTGMVEKHSSDYRKVTTDSGDLYLYGNNALWFSGGIIYTLNGNETLSEQQITQIAESVRS